MGDPRPRLNSLDVMKTVAAVSVVVIHCGFAGTPGIVIGTLASFAVPFFFMAMGYVISLRPPLEQHAYARQQGLRLLKYYAMAEAAYLAFFGAAAAAAGGLRSFMAGLFAEPWRLLASPAYGSTLWFLAQAGWVLLLVALALKRGRLPLLAGLSGLAVAAAVVGGAIWYPSPVPFSELLSIAFQALPYILVGYYGGRLSRRLPATRTLAAIGLALAALACLYMLVRPQVGYYDTVLATAPFSLAVFILALRWEDAPRVPPRIRGWTLPLYILHPMVIIALDYGLGWHAGDSGAGRQPVLNLAFITLVIATSLLIHETGMAGLRSFRRLGDEER